MSPILSLSKLAVAAVALLSVAAPVVMAENNAAQGHRLKVVFRRFAQPQCEERHHIAADTNLQEGKCKTFDKDEPPFESFKVTGPKKGNWRTRKCSAIAYDAPNCAGNAFTLDGKSSRRRHFFFTPLIRLFSDFNNTHDTCGSWQSPGGRSVFIRCEERQPAPKPEPQSEQEPVSTIVSMPPDTTVTSTILHTPPPTSTTHIVVAVHPVNTHTVLVHSTTSSSSPPGTLRTVIKAVTPATTITMMPVNPPTPSPMAPKCRLVCDDEEDTEVPDYFREYLKRSGY